MRAVSETEKNIPGLLSHILHILLENFAVRASLNKCYVQGCAASDGAAAVMADGEAATFPSKENPT